MSNKHCIQFPAHSNVLIQFPCDIRLIMKDQSKDPPSELLRKLHDQSAALFFKEIDPPREMDGRRIIRPGTISQESLKLCRRFRIKLRCDAPLPEPELRQLEKSPSRRPCRS